MRTTIIICEKPDAALHVAEALDEGEKPEKLNLKGVPFYHARRRAEKILVCSAIGHLYEVDAKESTKRGYYPVWDIAWKPKHLANRGQQRQGKWLATISEIAKEAEIFVNACDYDIEGSLIGYMILRYACDRADEKARRMKFSTLTAQELRDAYSNLMPHLDYPLVDAGRCRHEVDWLYGINLSRALTESARKLSGRYTTLSTGRVQGPTLRFVVRREEDIATFVPIPFWMIRCILDVDGRSIPAMYQIEKVKTRSEAENVVEHCAGKTGVVREIESSVSHIPPPYPFDLATLQSEAYRHFRLTPIRSLRIAERLYLDALISYPRTSSQKLPQTIGYKRIFQGLSRSAEWAAKSNQLLSVGELRANEGGKADPAHPAIYPTGNLPKGKLEPREQRLFDLIVKRFMATFGRPAVRESERVQIEVDGYIFYLKGLRTIDEGWTCYYEPYSKMEEVTLPRLEVGKKVHVRELSAQERFTEPPPRYNSSSLLKLMEEQNIGTKATRADIIETLRHRGYIEGERIIATPLAFQIIDLLSKYCPRVIDVEFTRDLEEMMEKIEIGDERREYAVLNAIEYLKPTIEELKIREREIGEELSETMRSIRAAQISLSTSCPQCKSRLFILRSRKSGKRFIGCSGRFKEKCDFSLPLPQRGKLTLLNKRCSTCGFQLVEVRVHWRRPLIACARCFVEKRRANIEAQPIELKPEKTSSN